jgi:hypothetical protein
MSELNRVISTLAGFHLAALDENKPEHAASVKKAIEILEALEDYEMLIDRMDVVQGVWAYYLGARGVGHTELLLNGVLNYDGDMAVIVGAQSEADRFKMLAQNDRLIVPYNRFDLLVGQQLPLAWDNHAIIRIFSSLSVVQSTLRAIKTIANGNGKEKD